FRIRTVNLCYLFGTDYDLEFRWFGPEEGRSILRSDVGDEVAEPINLENDAPQRVVVNCLRTGSGEPHKILDLVAHAVHVHTLGQIRSDGREDVSCVKSIADRLQKIVLRRDVANAEAVLTIINHREHPRVRPPKSIFLGRNHDRSTLRAYARINNNEMHGPTRKIGISLRNRKSTIEYVERLHEVRDVDEADIRHIFQDYTLNRADEMILNAEISGQSDDRRTSHRILFDKTLDCSEDAKLNGRQRDSQGTPVIKLDSPSTLPINRLTHVLGQTRNPCTCLRFWFIFLGSFFPGDANAPLR